MLVAKITSDFLNTVPVYMFRGQDVTLGSGKTVIRIFYWILGNKRHSEWADMCLNPG